METLKNKLYGFIDGLNLSLDLFRTQGLILIILASIKAVLLVISLVAATTFLSLLGRIGVLPDELSILVGLASGKLILLILPFAILSGFLIYIEMKSGLAARKANNTVEEKQELAKWSKYYIVYIVLTIVAGLVLPFGGTGVITTIVNIASAVFYYYFTRKTLENHTL